MRRFQRHLSQFHLPEHLQSSFLTTPTLGLRAVIVGKPLYKYPIAVVPPPPEVRVLMDAIRNECECRPFRIVSNEDEQGRVFNASFFDDQEKMHQWVDWLLDNALTPGSRFHECLLEAKADAPEQELPSSGETLLFARGVQEIADTRFGEYMVGMAACYTRQVPVCAERHAEMIEEAAAPEFEQRIARCMQEEGIAYFGRLAMVEDSDVTGHGSSPPALLTILRYGSPEDARRGTAAVRELMHEELTRWFGNQHASMIGTITQCMEL